MTGEKLHSIKRRKRSRKPWGLDLGATVTPKGVRFRVWAPRASSLSLRVVGCSNDLSMIPEENGFYSLFVKDLGAGARYFYVLEGEYTRPDPVSRFQPEGVHGPSEVIDPDDFPWEDHNWKGVPLEEMIIYEIHTGTYTREGTFEAIISSLDYLMNDLRVTAIELMPVGQFPGERNWGYDGTYLFAPQNSYGGPKGLKSLINECHKKGLAVILDVVYNHLGPEGNYLANYGPYFTDRYKTPWGSAINFDGPESDEVRNFIIDNALYWVTEYHVDGLRIDAIHGIFDFSARHILNDIGEAVHQQAKKLGRSVWVIAESDLNDVRVIDSPKKGGYALDAQWNDDFHHCLHTLLTGERNGYYEDFGEIEQLAKALREGFVYSGQYSSYRRRRHGSSSKHLPPSKFVVFSQNHDQVGNRARGDRLSTLVPFEALKLTAAFVLLAPNLPLLFMGEEYGEEAPFQYFVSHSDPELIEAVRRGRKEEFSTFQWEGTVPDPQDEMTFLRSKIDLELRHHEKHRTLLEFYRTLIQLRKEIPSLSTLDKRSIKIEAFESEKAILIKRQSGSDQVIEVFNFNEKPVRIETMIDKGNWQRLIGSACERWNGIGALAPDSITSSDSEMILVLDAYAFALYRKVEES
ncbi:MAG: malto-oligosyltrehalose trehalohydrolase [Thermodesulfobacteriota bacterium]